MLVSRCNYTILPLIVKCNVFFLETIFIPAFHCFFSLLFTKKKKKTKNRKILCLLAKLYLFSFLQWFFNCSNIAFPVPGIFLSEIPWHLVMSRNENGFHDISVLQASHIITTQHDRSSQIKKTLLKGRNPTQWQVMTELCLETSM